MRYLGQPLNGLFCLASLGEAHQALLERLCALPGVKAWTDGALAENDFRAFEEPYRLER